MCALAAAPAYGQADSSSVSPHRILDRVAEHNASAAGFVSFGFANPALNGFRWESRMNDIHVGMDMRDEDEAYVLQNGRKSLKYSFAANSYKPLGRGHLVWGGASYRTGRIEDVDWNLNSDYHIIYPYVTVDTLVKKLKHETYGFNGGYFYDFGRISAGVHGDLRAQHEYTTSDPRPRNQVVDLRVAAGASVKIAGRYRFGVSFMGRMYKQNSNVRYLGNTVYSDLSMVSGLGAPAMVSSRGSGGLLYKGSALGGSADLVPVSGKGLYVRAVYDCFTFDRISDNNNNAPVSKMIHHTVSVRAAYLGRSGRFDWGVSGEYAHRYREGIEYILKNVSSSTYVILARLSKYEERASDYAAGLLAGYSDGRGLSVHVRPTGRVSDNKIRYEGGARVMKIDYLEAGVDVKLTKRWNKALLQCSAGVNRHIDNGSELTLPPKVSMNGMKEGSFEMVNYIFSRYSSNYTSYSFGFRVDLPAWKEWALFVAADWTHGRFEDGLASDEISLKLGVAF